MDPIVTDANAPIPGAATSAAPGEAPGIAPGAAPGANARPLIMDTDQNGFMADVIEASREGLVIVDFWATWCGPCKTLTPIIEKVVQKAGGAVRLVKIDVDKAPDISGQLQIKSIPTIYAFKDGQPVDGFQGALPESQVQAWVDELITKYGGVADAGPSPLEQTLDAADAALAEDDIANAGGLYAQVLNQEPENPRALTGMIRAYLKAGQHEKARDIANQATPEILKSDLLSSAMAALELAEAGSAVAGEIDSLRAAMEADPADNQAAYDFAVAAFASGDPEAAIEALVGIIRRKRDWNEDAARVELLKIFEALGPTDPITNDGRRKLSSVLFS
jgi:putative thioredoxin